MIRIAFVNFLAGYDWLGGLNYLRNLLRAVADLDGRRVEPVLFSGYRSHRELAAEFPFIPVVLSPIFDRMHPRWILRKLRSRVAGGDPALERLLESERIGVLSHSGCLSPGAHIPTLGWIPDLQHRVLPDLFAADEIRFRERQIALVAEHCTRILLSSEVAAGDLRSVDPRCAQRVRVLRFMSGLLHGETLPARAELEDRYGIGNAYLHVPNQFWVHKNHDILVSALGVLKRRGCPVTIVATGRMDDPRRPDHVARLLGRVRKHGLAEAFRPLGVVPYRDLLGLMRHAVAMINPSLFEGWSTTVEEAKSLGKSVLLSDIPVHREQAPGRARYFDPHDAEDVANAIRDAWTSFDRAQDEAMVAGALSELPRRVREFANAYQDIVLEAAAQAS